MLHSAELDPRGGHMDTISTTSCGVVIVTVNVATVLLGAS